MTRLSGDTVRVFATLAVVVIHGTSFSQEPFRLVHDFLSADFLAVVLGQSFRFSVPVFLMLSGYALTVRYGSDPAGINLREFTRSRTTKIVVPFVVWTLVMLAFSGRFNVLSQADSLWAGVVAAGKIFGRALVFGNGDYHLYFFSIILQCYVLFPLLNRLPAVPLLSAFLLLQIVLAAPMAGWLYRQGLALPAFPSPFCVYWLAYFQLGIVSARYSERVRRPARALRFPLLVALALALGYLLTEYVQRSYGGQPPGAYDHFNRLSVILFSLAFWFSVVAWDEEIARAVSGSPRVAAAVAGLGAVSFTIFLIHPNLLRLLRLLPLPILILNVLLLAAAVCGALLLFTYVRTSGLRLILGLPPARERP